MRACTRKDRCEEFNAVPSGEEIRKQGNNLRKAIDGQKETSGGSMTGWPWFSRTGPFGSGSTPTRTPPREKMLGLQPAGGRWLLTGFSPEAVKKGKISMPEWMSRFSKVISTEEELAGWKKGEGPAEGFVHAGPPSYATSPTLPVDGYTSLDESILDENGIDKGKKNPGLQQVVDEIQDLTDGYESYEDFRDAYNLAYELEEGASKNRFLC